MVRKKGKQGKGRKRFRSKAMLERSVIHLLYIFLLIYLASLLKPNPFPFLFLLSFIFSPLFSPLMIKLFYSRETRPSGQRCVLKHFWAYPLTKKREMLGGNLSTTIATFGGSYARELFWCYSWLFMPFWSFLHIEFSISCAFYKSVTYGPTDRPTDGHIRL